MKRLLILLALFLFTGSVFAADLYHITITSERDAAQLRALIPETIAKTNLGYIVLLDEINSQRINSTSLNFELIKSGIDKADISIDRRPDNFNTQLYPTLYENGGLRLLEVNLASLKSTTPTLDLLPAGEREIPIAYYPQQYKMVESLSSLQLPLDSLADLILESDLTFDISYIQTNVSRLPESISNENCRNWLFNRLNVLGLDSLYLDTFYVDIYGTPTMCQNIVAVKVGTVTPQYQIIVGAHYDSVEGSPGADDNGSGTIAVLKIAEILSQLDTDMSFKFILYDAEEEGLLGSYHHANQVYTNGDSLVLMFNMDMIGAAGNENQANVYHGTYTDHAEVYEYLADSLLNGFIAPPSGPSGRTDHVPYYEYGYNVIDLMEYNFSTVYHTPDDRITNMNMAYMTKMVKGALMTLYTISQTFGPIPIFSFTEPVGTITNINPLVPTKYQIAIESHYGGTYLPGSATLHYQRFGESEMSTLPFSEISENLFEVDMPIMDCYDEFGYYVTVDEVQTGPIQFPQDSYNRAVIADSTLYPFSDDFTNDLGWVSTTTGSITAPFERGQLPPFAYAWYYPSEDINGDGYCYITGNYDGASYATKGTRSITSPVIEIPGDEGYLNFYYFFNSYHDLDNDYLEILVNNGDDNWIKVAEYRQPDPYYLWAPGSVSFATMRDSGVVFTPTMQIRFSAVCGPLNTILECCIDDIRIVSNYCDQQHVHAAPSVQLGQPPLDVSIVSQCDYNVTSWLWDFGDGGSSTDENPSHTYTEPGTYNVRVDVQSDAGDYFTVHEHLVGVYADTIIGQTVEGPPGMTVEMEVYANNYVPLSEIVIPFSYTGPLGLTFKGYTTTGLRTENMTVEYINFNNFYKQITIGMTAPDNAPLDLGSGAIIKLLFEINSSSSLDDSTQVVLASYDTYQLGYRSILGDYTPEVTSGYIKAGSCCLGIRGNIDNDAENIIDVADLVYFVDYQFRDGDEPFCLEEADLVIDGVLDVGDLVFMVDYQFREGDEPPGCF